MKRSTAFTIVSLILAERLNGIQKGDLLVAVNGKEIALPTSLDVSACERRAASIKRFASNCSNDTIVSFTFSTPFVEILSSSSSSSHPVAQKVHPSSRLERSSAAAARAAISADAENTLLWDKGNGEQEKAPKASGKRGGGGGGKKGAKGVSFANDVVDLTLDDEPVEIVTPSTTTTIGGKTTEISVSTTGTTGFGSQKTTETSGESAGKAFTLNTVVEVKPFGYGHVVRIDKLDSISNRDKEGGRSRGNDDYDDNNGGDRIRYCVDLWCGAKAYVIEENVMVAKTLHQSGSDHHAPSIMAIQEDGDGSIMEVEMSSSSLKENQQQQQHRSSRAVTSSTSTTSGSSVPKITAVGSRVLARYPSWTSKGAVALTTQDVYKLTPTVYLNDSLVEFYLKFLRGEKLHPFQRKRAFVFNPFFYTQLGQKLRGIQDSWMIDPSTASLSSSSAAAAYTDLSKGTSTEKNVKKEVKAAKSLVMTLSDIDPFDYQFLFIPVNDKLHWSTAVICYPGLLLPGISGHGRAPAPASIVKAVEKTTVEKDAQLFAGVPSVELPEKTQSSSSLSSSIAPTTSEELFEAFSTTTVAQSLTLASMTHSDEVVEMKPFEEEKGDDTMTSSATQPAPKMNEEKKTTGVVHKQSTRGRGKVNEGGGGGGGEKRQTLSSTSSAASALASSAKDDDNDDVMDDSLIGAETNTSSSSSSSSASALSPSAVTFDDFTHHALSSSSASLIHVVADDFSSKDQLVAAGNIRKKRQRLVDAAINEADDNDDADRAVMIETLPVTQQQQQQPDVDDDAEEDDGDHVTVSTNVSSSGRKRSRNSPSISTKGGLVVDNASSGRGVGTSKGGNNSHTTGKRKARDGDGVHDKEVVEGVQPSLSDHHQANTEEATLFPLQDKLLSLSNFSTSITTQVCSLLGTRASELLHSHVKTVSSQTLLDQTANPYQRQDRHEKGVDMETSKPGRVEAAATSPLVDLSAPSLFFPRGSFKPLDSTTTQATSISSSSSSSLSLIDSLCGLVLSQQHILNSSFVGPTSGKGSGRSSPQLKALGGGTGGKHGDTNVSNEASEFLPSPIDRHQVLDPISYARLLSAFRSDVKSGAEMLNLRIADRNSAMTRAASEYDIKREEEEEEAATVAAATVAAAKMKEEEMEKGSRIPSTLNNTDINLDPIISDGEEESSILQRLKPPSSQAPPSLSSSSSSSSDMVIVKEEGRDEQAHEEMDKSLKYRIEKQEKAYTFAMESAKLRSAVLSSLPVQEATRLVCEAEVTHKLAIVRLSSIELFEHQTHVAAVDAFIASSGAYLKALTADVQKLLQSSKSVFSEMLTAFLLSSQQQRNDCARPVLLSTLHTVDGEHLQQQQQEQQYVQEQQSREKKMNEDTSKSSSSSSSSSAASSSTVDDKVEEGRLKREASEGLSSSLTSLPSSAPLKRRRKTSLVAAASAAAAANAVSKNDIHPPLHSSTDTLVPDLRASMSLSSPAVTSARHLVEWKEVHECAQLVTHTEELAFLITSLRTSLLDSKQANNYKLADRNEAFLAACKQYKIACSKQSSIETDLVNELNACHDPPSPCIIFLDSLKMHSGREIARRLRLYLEAWFRAKYMSRAESVAVFNLSLQKPGKAAAAAAVAASTSAAKVITGGKGKGRGGSTNTAVPLINLTGQGGHAVVAAATSSNYSSSNASGAPSGIAVVADADAVDDVSVANPLPSTITVSEGDVLGTDVAVNDNHQIDSVDVEHQQHQQQDALLSSSSSSSSSSKTMIPSLIPTLGDAAIRQSSGEIETTTSSSSIAAVTDARPTYSKTRTGLPLPSSSSSSSSSVDDKASLSSTSALPQPPSLQNLTQQQQQRVNDKPSHVATVSTTCATAVITIADTSATEESSSSSSSSTRGNDPLSMDFFLASLASAPGHRRRGRTSNVMMTIAPPPIAPAMDSILLPPPPPPPPPPPKVVTKTLSSTEQQPPLFPHQDQQQQDEAASTTSSATIVHVVDNEDENMAADEDDVTRGNDPLSFNFILSSLSSSTLSTQMPHQHRNSPT